MNRKILIIDDDESIRSQMKWSLAEEYEVQLASDRPTGLEMFHAHHSPVVLLDLGLPPSPGDVTEGMAALSEILALAPGTKVIIVSGQSDKSNALRAIEEGAYDFFAKPVEIEELKVILKRAFYLAELESEHRQLQARLGNSGFEGMLGTSPAMQDVFNAIRKVAATEVPVLILGESGTGKERAAQALHNLSKRKDGPFIAINCGAIPENLLESELFGHEKGAFTGAHAQRPGKVEMAQGGTLFLDEIGELPQALQVKFLRFLQERVIQRVGGRKDISVDIRLVAATNADLSKSMAEGKFREDLFFRLAVVRLKLPPLRDRTGDIGLLATAFLKRFAAENANDKLKFSPSALRTMEQYQWPGNIRELENRVRRAVIMADGNRITDEDLELSGNDVNVAGRTLKDAREALEREFVSRALARHNGNISQAALELGISRPTMYELMDRIGIKKPETATEFAN
jgi:two-component system NtrC family response regulator